MKKQSAKPTTKSTVKRAPKQVALLPSFEATIQKYGVAFHGLRYSSSVLGQYIGTKSRKGYLFRYDPKSLAQVYFLVPDSQVYLTIPCINAGKSPTISLATLKAKRQELKLKHPQVIDIAALDSILDQAKVKAARNVATQKINLPNDGPLQVVAVEHCKLDISVVDQDQRISIGRPYLTVAMDQFSHVVTGFSLSFDETGAKAVGACLAHSILPKEGWLGQRQIKADWPIFGVPATIMVDNALEFRSPDLAKACEAYGINIAWRPLGSPHFSAPIERFMTSLTKELKKLPASTLSLEELEKWITLYVAIYHNRVNSHIQATPLSKFKEGILTSGTTQLVLDEERVRLDFLPTHEVTVQKYGIQFKGQKYSHPMLAPYVKCAGKHHIRYNPVDLNSIYFYDSKLEKYFVIPKA